ncbi:hypothetical protein Btru_070100 [Bulinus truncatus]|nr:hypothetical protein Btru_070100 [Bulinus truncatus]
MKIIVILGIFLAGGLGVVSQNCTFSQVSDSQDASTGLYLLVTDTTIHETIQLVLSLEFLKNFHHCICDEGNRECSAGFNFREINECPKSNTSVAYKNEYFCVFILNELTCKRQSATGDIGTCTSTRPCRRKFIAHGEECPLGNVAVIISSIYEIEVEAYTNGVELLLRCLTTDCSEDRSQLNVGKAIAIGMAFLAVVVISFIGGLCYCRKQKKLCFGRLPVLDGQNMDSPRDTADRNESENVYDVINEVESEGAVSTGTCSQERHKYYNIRDDISPSSQTKDNCISAEDSVCKPDGQHTQPKVSEHNDYVSASHCNNQNPHIHGSVSKMDDHQINNQNPHINGSMSRMDDHQTKPKVFARHNDYVSASHCNNQNPYTRGCLSRMDGHQTILKVSDSNEDKVNAINRTKQSCDAQVVATYL